MDCRLPWGIRDKLVVIADSTKGFCWIIVSVNEQRYFLFCRNISVIDLRSTNLEPVLQRIRQVISKSKENLLFAHNYLNKKTDFAETFLFWTIRKVTLSIFLWYFAIARIFLLQQIDFFFHFFEETHSNTRRPYKGLGMWEYKTNKHDLNEWNAYDINFFSVFLFIKKRNEIFSLSFVWRCPRLNTNIL